MDKLNAKSRTKWYAYISSLCSYVQTLNVADVADRMEGDFDVINQRKYTSRHCNQDYAVRIDTVKVELGKEGSSKRLTGR